MKKETIKDIAIIITVAVGVWAIGMIAFFKFPIIIPLLIVLLFAGEAYVNNNQTTNKKKKDDTDF
jgi:hypothetical protein